MKEECLFLSSLNTLDYLRDMLVRHAAHLSDQSCWCSVGKSVITRKRVLICLTDFETDAAPAAYQIAASRVSN